MPKRSSKREDEIQAARRVVDIATRQRGPEPVSDPEPVREKNPAAVALGRLGGVKGGPARAASLSPKKRSEIAKKAAAVRWKR